MEVGKTGSRQRSVYGKTEAEARAKMDHIRNGWAGDELHRLEGDGLTQHVYFVQSAIGGPVKIGTAADVGFRLSKLQACCPFPLKVLHAIPAGGAKLERELHIKFAPFRLHGEWFDNSRELMAYIARLQRENGRKKAPVRSG